MREKTEYAEAVLHAHDDDAAIRQSRINHPPSGSSPVCATMNPYEHGQAGITLHARCANVQIQTVLLTALLLCTVPTNKSLQAGRDGLYGGMNSRLGKEGLRRLPAQWANRRLSVWNPAEHSAAAGSPLSLESSPPHARYRRSGGGRFPRRNGRSHCQAPQQRPNTQHGTRRFHI